MNHSLNPISLRISIFDEDPLFVDFSEYNYAIDSLSPAINMGNVEIGSLFPFDLKWKFTNPG